MARNNKWTVAILAAVVVAGCAGDGGSQSLGADKTGEKVCTIVAELMGVRPDAVSRETHLVKDLGADDLDRVELVMELEDEFALEISDEDLKNLQTVGDLIDYVGRRAK